MPWISQIDLLCQTLFESSKLSFQLGGQLVAEFGVVLVDHGKFSLPAIDIDLQQFGEISCADFVLNAGEIDCFLGGQVTDCGLLCISSAFATT